MSGLVAFLAAWALICLGLAALRKPRLLFFGMPLLFCLVGVATNFGSTPPVTLGESRLDMVGHVALALFFILVLLASALVWGICGLAGRAFSREYKGRS